MTGKTYDRAKPVEVIKTSHGVYTWRRGEEDASFYDNVGVLVCLLGLPARPGFAPTKWGFRAAVNCHELEQSALDSVRKVSHVKRDT